MDQNNRITISSSELKYWPTDSNRKPDLLDFLLLKYYPDDSSDHTPVILTVSRTLIQYENPAILGNTRTVMVSERILKVQYG